ncbi:MAG: KpsF/GutQ family sugar-phosphate isomerase [Candidatus Hydrogenedentota bacterium]|nr:MAG: KpsF/GutQ family sugar-phosphate isomerase [Candidatus Hydrogenedentota bacterium]
MNSKLSHCEKAVQETLQAEAFAVQNAANDLTLIRQIHKAAKLLAASPNRVITTGMGKSGIIARKSAATMTSTGTPSVFLHPADALHGDMGNVQSGEAVLAFSNSGETKEILELMKYLRLLGAKIVSITSNPESSMAKEADISIAYSLEKEGCPLELAPMASTTVSLAIADAIASALIILKKFKPADFGRYHPSGSLGRKLLTKLTDLMSPLERAYVRKQDNFEQILKAMVDSNLGAICVIGSKGHLRGIITDGDLKRILEKQDKNRVWQLTADQIMTPNPAYVFEQDSPAKAMHIMQEKNTYVLPVVKKNKKPIGMVRMHDLIGYV